MIGIVIGIAGINQGFFETLQGNMSKRGLLIQAIGGEQRMWFYGGEEVMAVIPNFLLTGLAAIAVSLVLIWWSLRCIDSRHGATVFMLLALPTWAFATRINKPLTWWKWVLPERIRPLLARSWPITLTGAVIFFLLGLFIAITLYKLNVSDPEIILNIDWSILLAGLVLFLFSFLGGLAQDIQQRAGGA